MDDRDSDRLGPWVHYVLLSGVAASVLLIVIGIPKTLIDRHAHAAEVQAAGDWSGTARAALERRGEAILYLGLLILMLTPVARVLVLAIGWGILKDYRFMAVACSVLMLLALSIVLGVAG